MNFNCPYQSLRLTSLKEKGLTYENPLSKQSAVVEKLSKKQNNQSVKLEVH